ncbi:2-amino-4-hydroxy-6-hydroxymethyldihydropteridine diphosphokinase [Adhaeribacter aerolatus]|uniref:2-amino-4-hydroxy-6-hydroxymethyldihydropteridine pyrophosphokinase n=1 Tax=Adhaeribacter aerolatus TaxID=670289 RepID=A0A512AW59_9BACT|nr:2-amino-4-hydroxy-6-hydroxymethyldihydropteridine diphosphokinase [Adhaeribacter aerolatus]GEO03954.1 2-amino-4-hydroxy-6-hydroxymethyldihydropteridine diphosphokinase [Adhaeribacter aerolatus]
MAVTYLLLGSNQGNREYFLNTATTALASRVGLVTQQSKIYETAAWGLEEQPAFLNQLLQISTALPPEELLTQINLIEKELGRERIIKWGARVIDIDILYYNHLILNLPELMIPHPRLQDRRFALMPLTELAPLFIHPVFRKTNQDLLKDCPDNLPVLIYEKK